MPSQNAPMPPTLPQDPPDTAGEAARYAVLRRIGPTLKHDLVVNLQAVAMMAEVLAARLDKAPPSAEDLQQQVGRIHRVAREAVANSLKVAAWLAPGEDEGVALHEGVEEAVGLVRSNFGFRGFSVRVELPPQPLEVSRPLLRQLLVAALIHLSDLGDDPAEMVVRGQVQGDGAVLALTRETLQEVADPETVGEDLGYRRLQAADVRALADEAGVDLQAPGAQGLALRIPRWMATRPLGIAPR